MFKKLYVALGIYTFCVFIYKVQRAAAPVAVHALDVMIEDLTPDKQ